jgi:hypothetical protein
MRRNYKFFLSLVGSLAVSLNTLFLSLPAASEEAQILPPQVFPSCPETLPILEADKASVPAEALSVVNTVPSSTNSGTVAPLTTPKTDPISTTEIPKQEVPKTTTAPKVSDSLLTSTPLSVPPVEPPTASRSTSLVKPSFKSLPLAPSVSAGERPVEPLTKSVIPASPSLPPVTALSAASTEEIPHTRYLATPPNSSSTTATSGVSENQPTGLEPELPTSTSSNLQATIDCTPVLDRVPVVNSAQTSVLPETAKTESPAPSPNNSDIEKSIENSERSLKGLRPF